MASAIALSPDILGGAIIGYLTAPGQYYQPDTNEYVRLGPLAPKNGRYVLQLANQLEEIIYVDALELIAVDHPPEFDVYPNERLLSEPPYPEFKLYPLRGVAPTGGRPRPPGRGRVGPSARRSTMSGTMDSHVLDIHGYAEDHALELNLGDLVRIRPSGLARLWLGRLRAFDF